WVSIPHRDDKNARERSFLKYYNLEFQSLIGTIKTSFGKYNIKNILLFQSLIGTIKTLIWKISKKRNKKVSIPYRDDKNLNGIKLMIFGLSVSIPYSDDKNLNGIKLMIFGLSVSIPYRDDKNNFEHFYITHTPQCFNPS
ncbi:MAG: hypothetical protein RMJ38_07700, partial [candidate division WOR-3 bacterium]|nr:hypothetical protein [candidate division WOR-3 bacterium]MDW8151303.1 hypothetical protein [candidate division WOR-3 bacterium]